MNTPSTVAPSDPCSETKHIHVRDFCDQYSRRWDAGESPETIATDLIADILRWAVVNSPDDDGEALIGHICAWAEAHAVEEIVTEAVR